MDPAVAPQAETSYCNHDERPMGDKALKLYGDKVCIPYDSAVCHVLVDARHLLEWLQFNLSGESLDV